MSEEDPSQDDDSSFYQTSDSDTSTASSGNSSQADQKGNQDDENEENGQDDQGNEDQEEDSDESESDDSSTELQNLKPLPVLELRDNPLGSGDGRTDIVNSLQGAMMVLGYYIGADGITGDFDDATEDAVKNFQQDNKDWRGNPLSADGKVDDLTSDAINRSLVGSWFDSYQTPVELTNDVVIVTVTKDTMRDPVSLGYSSQN
jgi:hypothetical protein